MDGCVRLCVQRLETRTARRNERKEGVDWEQGGEERERVNAHGVSTPRSFCSGQSVDHLPTKADGAIRLG